MNCLGNNVYPKALDIKHWNILICQLDQKTITEKMSICITHFKLKVIELGLT